MSELEFRPPKFVPSRWIAGGHLQTITRVSAAADGATALRASAEHTVPLGDGDAIVLHENVPVDGAAARPGRSARCALLIHGLGGCHRSPYMIRLAGRLLADGWTVYRADMRGAGAGRLLAAGLNHAGRSGDVQAALAFIAARNPGASISAAGVSLGGNQLLLMASRWGSDSKPDWADRLERIVTVAPPIELVRCSENMQRLSRRPYNYYFIRSLFDGAPPRVREHELFRSLAGSGRPRTLFQLDDRLTAPHSGFDGAQDYYARCGAGRSVRCNPIPTLVLAAEDDPIVPASCFRDADWPRSTHLLLTKTGGHAGFITAGRRSWMDDCVVAWMNQF
ncbi:alpha/beta fold hydrolase [Roseiconus nitratireducens]|uniref:Alpha/beta fold hydrolase n=1 Tax=Roseiconus nitratireducens TaxID=2605748 RepID=A0A5M6DB12_9BACT|nr:alpha/beta fold hydrolase [Roseiconus nitratireducens]KAA5544563.1 alpha/beta fold hydrolase [Roseiconus nitratireducens]